MSLRTSSNFQFYLQISLINYRIDVFSLDFWEVDLYLLLKLQFKSTYFRELITETSFANTEK